MADLQVPVDYTAADYLAIKSDLLRRAERILPEWTSRSEADFGVVLAELFSHSADLNNYAIDRMLGESYLPTATTMQAVLTIADIMGYIPHAATAATGSVTMITDVGGPAVVVPKGTIFTSDYVDSIDGIVYYESTADVTVPGNGGTAVVPVAEGRTTTKMVLGVSDGTESQQFYIPHHGVIEGSVRIFVEGPHADLEWSLVPRLIYSAPAELVYTIRPDHLGGTVITFGDSVNGAIPPLGSKIFATYRRGRGAAGNLAAGKISHVGDSLDGVTIATDGNGVPMSTVMLGGGDREDIESIRHNASIAYSAYGRAVTVTDYSKIALTVPGVTDANAISQVSSSVMVYIAGPQRSYPSVELIDAVRAQLSVAGAAGVRVTVGGPTVVNINLGSSPTPMRLTVAPTWKRAVVEQQVRTTITKIINSYGIGQRVSLGDIYAQITAMDGVLNITIPVLARADAAQTGASDIVLAPYELPAVGIVAIDVAGGVA